MLLSTINKSREVSNQEESLCSHEKEASMTNESKVHVNRTYKSTIFAMLFEDRGNLLELYKRQGL